MDCQSSGSWFLFKELFQVQVMITKADQWDAYNNFVITWLMNVVLDTIARSILDVQSSREVDKLEKKIIFKQWL